MRRLRCIAVGAIVVLALTSATTACGGDDNTVSSGSKHATTADTTAQSYVGLTKQDAIARAKASDTPWRITREDNETFIVTQDYVEDRVNFEIDNGKVTKATNG